MQGARLAEAEEIYVNDTDELSADVQRFIAACLLHRQKQQQKEKLRFRQAQTAAVAIVVLGVAALSLPVLTYQQSHKAKLEEIQALNSLSENYLLSHQQLEALLATVSKREKNFKAFGFRYQLGCALLLQSTHKEQYTVPKNATACSDILVG
jgi:hypothetical protein